MEFKDRIKSIFSDIGRQLFYSAIILIIGFLLLNYGAFSEIIKSRYNQITGKQSPLNEITETQKISQSDQQVNTIQTEVQKNQIPSLNLEISPSDNRIIIPRIDQNIPIIRVSSENLVKMDWGSLEKDIQQALKNGVVHYPGTSIPGQKGNTVITGHSSYFPWDKGRYKDVFALLHDVVIGDKIAIFYEQDKYIYEVTDIKVVLPEDIEILKQTSQDRLTLITCTPVGTNLKRLIVISKPIAKNNIPIESKITR